jgi:hypothetical protein
VLKRIRWMATGLAIGAGASLWAERKAKALAAKYSPSGAANRALGWLADVLAAVKEGREAMRQREAELRAASESRARPIPSEQRRARA